MMALHIFTQTRLPTVHATTQRRKTSSAVEEFDENGQLLLKSPVHSTRYRVSYDQSLLLTRHANTASNFPWSHAVIF